jgi:hypothetical protein
MSMNAERLVEWLKNFDLSNSADAAIVTKRLEEILSDLGEIKEGGHNEESKQEITISSGGAGKLWLKSKIKVLVGSLNKSNRQRPLETRTEIQLCCMQ